MAASMDTITLTISSGVAEVFEELRKEIIWLHARLIVYNQLYGVGAKS
jgi:hypothetical protein